MKTVTYIILTVGAIFLSGCYSAKSMGDSKKADKYLIVY
jgi:PBP1b-binding outer membrane lipoprotein LpoB